MLFCGIRVLAVIFSRLHLEDVGNYTVNGDVTYQASEEELLCDTRVHEAQGGETSQDTGHPGEADTQHVRSFLQFVFTCLLFVFEHG